MDTLSDTDTDRDDYAPRPPGHRLWLTLPTGLLAAAGGGAVVLGIFQRYDGPGTSSLRRAAPVPDWRLHLGLAIALGVAGLLAVLAGRTVLARTAAGMVVVPAIVLGTLTAGVAIGTLEPLIRAGGVDTIGPGGWLTMGGAAAGLLAALLALAQTGAYTGAGRGWLAPTLAAVGVVGLLDSWLAATVGPVGDPPLRSGYLAALTSQDHSGAITFAVLGGLGWAAVAIGYASGRHGAPAAGVALGAAVAVGVDLGVRLGSVQGLLDAAANLDRRDETFIALGATVLALLLLAVLLRGRPAPLGEEPAGEPLGFDSTLGREPPYGPVAGAPGYGDSPYERERERRYDSPYERERPYDSPAGYDRLPEPGKGYLPEHDPAPGARYPLLPDERAAQHPTPPRPGVSRPPDD